MSLRASLLTLYGLLLGVLAVALGGFYWAVERSLADQELLVVAYRQLRDIEAFGANSHGHFAETAKCLLIDNVDPKIVGELREQAKARIQRLVETVRSELELLKQHGDDGSESRKWKAETEELDRLLRIQEIHTELCDASDSMIARRKEIGGDKLVSMIRDSDNVLHNRLDPLLNRLRDDESEELLLRAKSMFQNSRLFERIAIGTCLATLVVTLTGTYFLRRTLEEVARKEGAVAADRAKSEFLANMSHEIRTPMTAILGYADILAQGAADPEKVLAAAVVKRNGEHLLEIINDILDLSKIDAGQLDIEFEPCSPSQIVADVLSLMRVRAAAKGLALNVEFKDAIPETIRSSPLRLRQILINLVGNAIKFTEVGGVRVVTQLVRDKKGEPLLRFDVIDTGIGISKENVRNLFKPFTQVDSSATKTVEGTGLGLAISQRLAKVLGGQISVTSVRGKGSEFSVTIRTGLLDGVKMIEHREELAPPLDAPAAQAIDKEQPKINGRILLVEDGPDNQRLISFLLRRAGAEVTLADNGIVALERVEQAMHDMMSGGEDSRKAPFDIILMDMQMPQMDGYEVTRRLRNVGYRHPIVALTAHAMSTDRQKCLDAGCDDYITKPISEDNLLKTLAVHLRAVLGEATLVSP